MERVITSVTFTCYPADIRGHGRDAYVTKACLTVSTSQASPSVSCVERSMTTLRYSCGWALVFLKYAKRKGTGEGELFLSFFEGFRDWE
ncbi:hypothetical protein Zmor_015069 [Zophobas morio]|uniref:Uncharacterized protein n=1 Tax=Zophobas morio TaxID=2755281 RepID=A0AA38ILD8_9CUCU|nr:hypothetical protein Zmor_015069 [Zophobas morio]